MTVRRRRSWRRDYSCWRISLTTTFAVERYRTAGRAVLDGLIANYTTFDRPGAEGLLLHGASHVSRGYTDTMLPYGDYFFVEALLRAQGYRAFFW